MNTIELASNAEKKAEQAENLKAFSGTKLLHIKREIAKILGLIGREGIFNEYTKHDISHIDYMLDSLDFIIPEQTQKKLTPTEWLMLTLSIYFHDLGMLVTKDEFNKRTNNVGFQAFKSSIDNGELGINFKEKIHTLIDEEAQDRFIYQEFIRHTHAKRVKYWINNEPNSDFPQDLQIINELNNLLSNLDPMFKRDLGNICESHHLSDLDDYGKYRVNQRYGMTIDEQANLNYIAIILRTADLLHITNDRTPNIEFRLINPNDPISQIEWAKQQSVKAIVPQPKQDKEGKIDPLSIPDTFEVSAYFEDEKGFFGLISYIDYANKQLKENHKINDLSNKLYNLNYQYPWKYIDDSKITTKDFEKRHLEFILNQNKILDLLVGHTLYNDSSVVLRELTQNSIDATKLFKYYNDKETNKKSYTPEINIVWHENKRELIFEDNGTGMSLDIIENHFLNVGSSKYQDEKFKKSHPEFSPISRFGIGLLTCFLIADDIDVITKTEKDEKAILLKIRNVHGKYLLKYISVEKIPDTIKSHGTSIKLYVRPDINLDNIEDDLKRWVIVPNCIIKLKANDSECKIGFNNLKEALKYFIEKTDIYSVDNINIKIEEVNTNDSSMAYVLQYNKYTKSWDFLTRSNTFRNSEYDDDQNYNTICGTCIEGIKVDSNAPGFTNNHIYSIINTFGKNAPKTNVARSSIEKTNEKTALLKNIYSTYISHYTGKSNKESNNDSLYWRAFEANYSLNSFIETTRGVIDDSVIFRETIENAEFILLESSGKSNIVKSSYLSEIHNFWTINSDSFLFANNLIKELNYPKYSSLELLKLIDSKSNENYRHIDNIVCNMDTSKVVEEIIQNKFEITEIVLFPKQNRFDFKWEKKINHHWIEIELEDINRDPYEPIEEKRIKKILLQKSDIRITNPSNVNIIKNNDDLIILDNCLINSFLLKKYKAHSSGILFSILINILTDFIMDHSRVEKSITSYIVSYLRSPSLIQFEDAFIQEFPIPTLLDLLNKKIQIFEKSTFTRFQAFGPIYG